MRPDRHGRAERAGAGRFRRPPDGYRLRNAERFAQLVTDLLPTLPTPLDKAAVRPRVIIGDVPPVGEDEDEPELISSIMVYGHVERLIVYRRPLEARAHNRFDLADLVREELIDHLAKQLGLDPNELAD